MSVFPQIDASCQGAIAGMNQKLGQTWEEWMQEREQIVALEVTRRMLRDLLEDRFGSLPEELICRIEANTDIDRLQSAILQTLRLQSLEELRL